MEAQHSLEELTSLTDNGESSDQEIFAEQRSNVLLYAGEHYSKKTSKFYARVRDSKELSNEQKIRLTKNHIQYICDTYANNIVAPNPGVGFKPRNENETHDQKVAQLHHAVWRDAHNKYNVDDKIDDWADSFVQIGEVCVKISYNPDKGKVKAYEQKTDEEGNGLFYDQFGDESTDDGAQWGTQFQPVPDESQPVYEGAFEIEEVYGFNLIRPAECKDIREAEWLTIRKMADIADLKKQFPEHEKKLQAAEDRTFKIFDTSRGGYVDSDKQTMLYETYFRPCRTYPNGYFYIWTKEAQLEQGELPGGIFPIVWAPFRKFPTTPRGRSPIKTMRPYQAEINRSASKMAEHQITLGDDKILYQNGTKLSATASLPGIRGVSYTGAQPTVLQGRDGSQYLNYMNSNITELYQVMGVKEDMEELPAQLDPYVMLFRAARQKKRFQRNIKRFEKFYLEVVTTYLKLAKVHLPDDTLIYAIGASEQVNMEEFRSTQDLCYEIEVEAQAEDAESKLGSQITINHALQYVGNRMDREDIGKLMRAMPYANFEESFEDMTIDYDNAVNDILALDKGKTPPVNQYDKHPYLIKKLTSRMRKADFQHLPPEVQMNYAEKVKLHQQFEAQNQLAIQRAQQGMIPTGGGMTKCDLYVPGDKPDSSPKRVTLPVESIQWLIKNLEAQAAGLAPLANMPEGAQAEVANEFTRMGGSQPAPGSAWASPQAMINEAAMSRSAATA